MPSYQASSDRSRDLSREADLLISNLHAAIRCRCCPDGLFTRHMGAAPEPSRPPLSRADFLGLLAAGDVDAELGGAA
jgi:hypothetical protein